MKIRKIISVGDRKPEMPLQIDLLQIVEEVRIRKNEAGIILELIIDGEPVEVEEKKERKRKYRFEKEITDEYVRLIYRKNGELKNSVRIPIGVFRGVFDELPERSDVVTVISKLTERGYKSIKVFHGYVLRIFAELFPDQCHIEKVGSKLFLVKKTEEKPEEEKKKEEKIERVEWKDLDGGTAYAIEGNVIHIRYKGEIYDIDVSKLELPNPATIADIRRAISEQLEGDIPHMLPMVVAKILEREFDYELRTDSGFLRLYKIAEH